MSASSVLIWLAWSALNCAAVRERAWGNWLANSLSTTGCTWASL